ncbi:MAG: hypothetical protein JO323_13095 [Acidobacteriia bacterium]|nr:hypothetical protein [Terriglobia bacterium]
MAGIVAAPLVAFGPPGWALYGLVLVGTAAIAAYEVHTAMEAADTTFSEIAAGAVQKCTDVVKPTILLMSQQAGKKIRGLTAQIRIHAARVLGTTVGGKPPDHQKDPKRDRPHWWKEIKEWLRQIREKGLSDKQLARELEERFSKEELDEIREALRRAAEQMNDEPPDFPPTATP